MSSPKARFPVGTEAQAQERLFHRENGVNPSISINTSASNKQQGSNFFPLSYAALALMLVFVCVV